MKSNWFRKSYWPFLLLLFSCLEKYQPPEVQTTFSSLVVDGLINPATNSATIRLARTSKLTDKVPSTPEKQAIVTLEEIGNATLIPLPENPTGIYTALGLNLDASKKYRVNIRTKEFKNYVSDDIVVKQTPPIDSLYWRTEGDGIMIYVATHDPTGNTRYYLWDFVETYQHNAFYYARYKVVNSTIVERPAGEQNYYCWSIINSTNIFLGSTKKFSEDRINFPIMFIPKGSIKVSIKYTLFVRQQALTEESFLYWQQLQKTTENIGGLFDPLPSRVVGNVHNVADSTEPVMGYITGGSITSQRFWISTTQLPTDQQAAYSFGGCYTVPIEGFLASYNGDLVVDIAPPSVSFGHCVDCLIDGGSLIKPPYWP